MTKKGWPKNTTGRIIKLSYKTYFGIWLKYASYYRCGLSRKAGVMEVTAEAEKDTDKLNWGQFLWTETEINILNGFNNISNISQGKLWF